MLNALNNIENRLLKILLQQKDENETKEAIFRRNWQQIVTASYESIIDIYWTIVKDILKKTKKKQKRWSQLRIFTSSDGTDITSGFVSMQNE